MNDAKAISVPANHMTENDISEWPISGNETLQSHGTNMGETGPVFDNLDER
jgi:hypothetical protein